MSRKLLIFLLASILITTAVYLYLKYKVLAAPGVKADVSKKETPLDLRPQVIAKLQQLVKDGSDGLYRLEVDEFNPDLTASTVDIKTASLVADSSMLDSLDKAGLLPDDIFKITLRSVHITGLGLADLMNKKSMDLGDIAVENPIVEVFHNPKPYNKQTKRLNEQRSLYQKISGQFNSISVDKISLSGGTFIHHNQLKNVTTKIERAGIRLQDILIDSATQQDKNRYLFAKTANLHAENYHVVTPDSYYAFDADKIDVSGVDRHMVATSIHLAPNGGRAAMMKKLKDRKVIFDVKIPRLEMSGVDWWSLINREEWVATEGSISNATIGVYVDRRLPAPVLRKDNFPHQILMRMPVPLAIKKLLVQNSKVVYEEFNPQVMESATVTIGRINGTIYNCTNSKSDIAANPWTKINTTALLMNEVPIRLDMNLDLAHVSTGNFNASILVDTLNNTLINPVSEKLSLFRVKSGQVQKGKGHLTGNNTMAKGNISLQYSDLHVTPLKPQQTDEGEQKSKHLTSFIANLLFIKNSNPKDGELRQPDFLLHRDPYTGFVKMIWLAIRAGIVKSVGIPLKKIDPNAE